MNALGGLSLSFVGDRVVSDLRLLHKIINRESIVIKFVLHSLSL